LIVEIAHETIYFQINKPSTTIVHIVDIFIYIYIGFFSGRTHPIFTDDSAKKEATKAKVPIG
jgi:hypothetical protein